MYTILGFPSSGLMRTRHPRWGEQVWALAKLRSHKSDDCAICSLSVGSDEAFRPIGNAGNRMERICVRHLMTAARNE